MADPLNPEPIEADPAAIRAFIIGTAFGVVIVGGFCAVTIWLLGGGLGGALVVGAFCAVIGGPGFGGMMGFIVHQDRTKRRAETESEQPSTPLQS